MTAYAEEILTVSIQLTRRERREMLVALEMAASDWEKETGEPPELAEASRTRAKILREIVAKIEAVSR